METLRIPRSGAPLPARKSLDLFDQINRSLPSSYEKETHALRAKFLPETLPTNSSKVHEGNPP